MRLGGDGALTSPCR